MHTVRRYMRGVTLIELMTVMVILAILSTIAIGSYRRYSMKANRTDATMSLLKIQAAEKNYFLQNNAYTNDLSNSGLAIGTTSPAGFYTLGVIESAASPGPP